MLPPPPPAKCPTTVLDLDDFLLREVFLRLPALPSLVRGALACRTFLRAVRSSPTFRRSFQALHPSPFVGIFVQPFIKGFSGGFEPEDPYFDAHHLSADRDFAAAVRGGDFDLTGLPLPDEDDDSYEEDENNDMEEDSGEQDENNDMEEDPDGEDGNSEDEEEEDTDGEDENNEDEEEEDDEEEDENNKDEEEDEEQEDENNEEEEYDEAAASPVWQIERCCDGYVVLFNQRAKQIAAYNPLTLALHLYPSPPRLFSDAINFEFHIISSQEDPGVPPRVVVCFYTDFDQAVVGVISSDTSIESEWQKFPESAIGLTSRMVNGSIYWTHVGKPYMTVLDTKTLQFTKMDLPPHLAEQDDRVCAFVLGNTRDGRPCIVSPGLWGDCSLNVYFWRRKDEYFDDGLNYWILVQTFHLKMIHQFVKFSEGDDEFIFLRLMQLIDGVLYLCTAYDRYTEAPPLLLSFCLETTELKMICGDYHKPINPYIMAWPPSLVLDKGPYSKGQALSTPESKVSYVKARGGLTGPASVAKA